MLPKDDLDPILPFRLSDHDSIARMEGALHQLNTFIRWFGALVIAVAGGIAFLAFTVR